MRTWLDYYILGALDSLPKSIRQQLPHETDADAMLYHVLLTLRDLQSAEWMPDNANVPRNMMFACLLPFLVRATGAPADILQPSTSATVAVQVSPDLIEDFAHATAPDTDAWRIPMQNATWYIDIPHHALLVGEHEVRAIFTQGTMQGDMVVVVVLAPPGSDRLSGRYVWTMNDPSPVLGMSAPDEIDGEYLRESINNLIRLISLYRLTADYRQERLPQTSVDDLSKLRLDKQRARQKTHSIFRVGRLTSPPGRFGREHTGERAWILTHRVSVRGHFRWQPYGPEHRLRRLQWIAAHHRGPEDGGEKIDIERLK
ncbi:MAG: hypothetical protein ABFD54_05930 [Armatimonadota bacterium]|nr:hypothetical protein [bacterium]